MATTRVQGVRRQQIVVASGNSPAIMAGEADLTFVMTDGTGTLQYTVSSLADINAGTAVWNDWPTAIAADVPLSVAGYAVMAFRLSAAAAATLVVLSR